MNVRATSIKTYHTIENEGLLSAWRWRVYRAVYKHGPMTSGEATRHLTLMGHPISQLRARFTELRELGVLNEVGERVCEVSGRMCIVWDVTDALPTGDLKKKKPPTKAQCAAAALDLRKLRNLAAIHNRPFSAALLEVYEWVKMRGESSMGKNGRVK